MVEAVDMLQDRQQNEWTALSIALSTANGKIQNASVAVIGITCMRG